MPHNIYNTREYFREPLPHIHERLSIAHRVGSPKYPTPEILKLYGLIEGVVLKTLKRNPSWEAIGTQGVRFGSQTITNISLFKDKELLGSVFQEYRGVEFCIGLNSPSIARSVRGGVMKTTIESSALSSVKKYFIEKSQVDILRQNATEAYQYFSVKGSDNNSKMHTAYNYSIAPALKDYVAEHLDALTPYLLSKGLAQDKIDMFIPLHADATTLSDLDKFGALVVTMENGSCVYIPPTDLNSVPTALSTRLNSYINPDTPPNAYITEDTLPEPVKTRMAMLRLVEATGQLVPNIGIRFSDTVYIVYEHALS